MPEHISEEDEQHLEAALENWNEGWRMKDAARATCDYSEDADFTNAFGMTSVGRAEIQNLLAGVFDLPFVMTAESETAEQSVRFIRPNIALVRSLVLRRGQKSARGEDLGTRNTSHLRVFVKTKDSWQIVSHLISDARDRTSAHH